MPLTRLFLWPERSNTYRRLATVAGLPPGALLPHEAGDALALCTTWLGAATVYTTRGEYAAVWMDNAFDVRYAASRTQPAWAFWLHCAAVSLCEWAIVKLVPEIRQAGCAPLPDIDTEAMRLLTEEGLPCGIGKEHIFFGKTYAVFTYRPWRGKCRVCSLQAACPRLPSPARGQQCCIYDLTTEK